MQVFYTLANAKHFTLANASDDFTRHREDPRHQGVKLSSTGVVNSVRIFRNLSRSTGRCTTTMLAWLLCNQKSENYFPNTF